MSDDQSASRLGPRFFGRRRGKPLRRTALGLIEVLLPRLAIGVPGQGVTLDPAALFPEPPAGLWLEVGFGGGEHLAAQAAAHPGIGMIGCEVFRNGIASLLGHIQAQALDNIRIFAEDARLLLPALPAASLDRAFVLFPDPWPKKRHADRRFVSPDNLDTLARLLKDGAELRIASDDPIYVEWATEQLAAHAGFEVALATQDRRLLPTDWPSTRYEQKAIAGQATFFLARRRPRE